MLLNKRKITKFYYSIMIIACMIIIFSTSKIEYLFVETTLLIPNIVIIIGAFVIFILRICSKSLFFWRISLALLSLNCIMSIFWLYDYVFLHVGLRNISFKDIENSIFSLALGIILLIIDLILKPEKIKSEGNKTKFRNKSKNSNLYK